METAIGRGDFVRDGQIQPEELTFLRKPERFAQFASPNMESRVLHVDVGVLEGGILNFRRKRMGDRIAENAQPDWPVEITCDLPPIAKIFERISVLHLGSQSSRVAQA